MQTQSGLGNEFGQSVALRSVHLEGQLQGLLLTMTMKQLEIPAFLTRRSQGLLNAEIARIDPSLVQEAEEQLAQVFASISKTSWGQAPAITKRSLLYRFRRLMTGG